MTDRIKLIWDFHGPNAELTAKHHATHLGEYAKIEGLQNTIHSFEKISDMHYVAYLVIEKPNMDAMREILKPNRGQLYIEK